MLTLLDANVLYSITLTDVLLTLAEEGLFTPLWTERILDEAHGHLAERGVVQSERRFSAMRRAFRTAMVPPHRYEHLISTLRNDPGDRHVLAAAVAYQAELIVTRNVRHFPRAALQGLPVGEVVTPDTFLLRLHEAEPARVLRGVDRLLAGKRRPPMTAHDLVRRLERSGADGFAARLIVSATARPPR